MRYQRLGAAVFSRPVGRFAEAVADCERAMAHPDGDRSSLSDLLARCRAQLPVPA